MFTIKSKIILRLILLQLAVYFITSSSGVWASEAEVNESGSIIWKDSTDGVSIAWKNDGSIETIQSKYTVYLNSIDRKEIQKGMIIAEEKAKANLVRFLEQDITTTTSIIRQIETDVKTAFGTAGHETENNIRIKEQLTEITSSYASGTLAGIIVLAQGVEKKSQVTWIVVGLNPKIIELANRVKSGF